MALAEEGPQSLEKIAEVLGLAGPSSGEMAVKAALKSFVRAAIAMGMPELVSYLEDVTLTGNGSDE